MSCLPAKSAVSSDWLVSQDDWGNDSWGTNPASQTNERPDLVKSLEKLLVTTPGEDLSDEDDSGMDISVVQVESPKAHIANVANELQHCEQTHRGALEGLVKATSFRSYYISVVEEERRFTGDSTTDSHIKELLESYESNDGTVSKSPSKGQGNCSYAQEIYEKASISHGDQTFYKFHKRLQYCPQQLVR